jgi:geranylgeranyl pyrophosphate synthase
LSKTQYRHLITILEKTNALNKTERIVRKYFQKALSYIPKEFHKHERRMIESFVSTMERQLHDLIVKK